MNTVDLSLISFMCSIFVVNSEFSGSCNVTTDIILLKPRFKNVYLSCIFNQSRGLTSIFQWKSLGTIWQLTSPRRISEDLRGLCGFCVFPVGTSSASFMNGFQQRYQKPLLAKEPDTTEVKGKIPWLCWKHSHATHKEVSPNLWQKEGNVILFLELENIMVISFVFIHVRGWRHTCVKAYH